jgi:hypothetical protein
LITRHAELICEVHSDFWWPHLAVPATSWTCCMYLGSPKVKPVQVKFDLVPSVKEQLC